MSKMSLVEYIEMHGDDRSLAKEWGVTLRAVRSWKYRERIPCHAMARLIIKKTKGRVDCEGIYLR